MKAAFYICNTPFRKYRQKTITPHTTEMLLCRNLITDYTFFCI